MNNKGRITEKENENLLSANDIYNKYQSLFAHSDKLILLIQNKDKRITKAKEIYKNPYKNLSFLVNDIIYELLVFNAPYFMLIRCKLNESIYPKDDDYLFSKLVHDYAHKINIKMCDYLIANRSDYYSFKEQGKLYENG